MEWIDVKDCMPQITKTDTLTHSENVLALCESGEMYVAHVTWYPITPYREEESFYWSENTTGCGCCCGGLKITHWMPLPEIP